MYQVKAVLRICFVDVSKERFHRTTHTRNGDDRARFVIWPMSRRRNEPSVPLAAQCR